MQGSPPHVGSLQRYFNECLETRGDFLRRLHNPQCFDRLFYYFSRSRKRHLHPLVPISIYATICAGKNDDKSLALQWAHDLVGTLKAAVASAARNAEQTADLEFLLAYDFLQNPPQAEAFHAVQAKFLAQLSSRKANILGLFGKLVGRPLVNYLLKLLNEEERESKEQAAKLLVEFASATPSFIGSGDLGNTLRLKLLDMLDGDDINDRVLAAKIISSITSMDQSFLECGCLCRTLLHILQRDDVNDRIFAAKTIGRIASNWRAFATNINCPILRSILFCMMRGRNGKLERDTAVIAMIHLSLQEQRFAVEFVKDNEDLLQHCLRQLLKLGPDAMKDPMVELLVVLGFKLPPMTLTKEDIEETIKTQMALFESNSEMALPFLSLSVQNLDFAKRIVEQHSEKLQECIMKALEDYQSRLALAENPPKSGTDNKKSDIFETPPLPAHWIALCALTAQIPSFGSTLFSKNKEKLTNDLRRLLNSPLDVVRASAAKAFTLMAEKVPGFVDSFASKADEALFAHVFSKGPDECIANAAGAIAAVAGKKPLFASRLVSANEIHLRLRLVRNDKFRLGVRVIRFLPRLRGLMMVPAETYDVELAGVILSVCLQSKKTTQKAFAFMASSLWGFLAHLLQRSDKASNEVAVEIFEKFAKMVPNFTKSLFKTKDPREFLKSLGGGEKQLNGCTLRMITYIAVERKVSAADLGCASLASSIAALLNSGDFLDICDAEFALASFLKLDRGFAQSFIGRSDGFSLIGALLNLLQSSDDDCRSSAAPILKFLLQCDSAFIDDLIQPDGLQKMQKMIILKIEASDHLRGTLADILRIVFSQEASMKQKYGEEFIHVLALFRAVVGDECSKE